MYCLDSSVIVNSVIDREQFHESSLVLMERINREKILVLVPDIALPEVASAISRGTGSGAKAKVFVRALMEMPNFTFIPIDKELALLAAELAADYGLRGADSLYVAVAYQYRCRLISLDKAQIESGSEVVDAISPKDELARMR